MKKLLLGLCCFYSLNASSQITNYLSAKEGGEFMFEAGVGGSSGFQLNDKEGYLSGGGGLALNFRYILQGQENSSITIGSHAIFGTTTASKKNSDGSFSEVSALYIDIPIVVDFNIGKKSNKITTNRMGAHIGGGYDFISGLDNLGNNVLFHGPVVNASVRFPVGTRGRWSNGVYQRRLNNGLHASIMLPFNGHGFVVSGWYYISLKRDNAPSGGRKKSSNWEWIR